MQTGMIIKSIILGVLVFISIYLKTFGIYGKHLKVANKKYSTKINRLRVKNKAVSKYYFNLCAQERMVKTEKQLGNDRSFRLYYYTDKHIKKANMPHHKIRPLHIQLFGGKV